MGGNDGTIVVGTSVNTDGIKDGITEIERETEKIKDINVDVSAGDYAQGLLDALDDVYKEYKDLTSGSFFLESDLQKADVLKQQIIGIINEIERVSGEKIIIKGINDVKDNLPSIEDRIKSIGKSVEKVGTKIAKIGLSMIGIHSLYGMISSSLSRITATQPELKAQIDAIKNAIDNIVWRLVQAVLPVIQFLVGLIGEIMQGLFGIDIYANNFNKNMNKASKGAGKLRKQLMGFDEMNILNKDTGSTGILGALGDTGGTNTDYNKIKNKVTNTIAGVGETVVDTIGTKLLLLGGGGGYILWYLLFGDKNGPTKTQKAVTKFLRNVNSQLLGAKATFKNGLVEVKTASGDVIHYTEDEFNDLMSKLGYTTDKKTGEIKEIVLNASDNLEKNIKQNAKETAKSVVSATVEIGNAFTGENGVEEKIKGAIGFLPTEAETKTKQAVDVITSVISNFTPPDVNINTKSNVKSVVDNIVNIAKNTIPPEVEVKADQKTLTSSVVNTITSLNPLLSINATVNKNTLVSSVVNAVKGVKIPLTFGITSAGLSGVGALFGAKGLMINPPRLASGGIVNRVGSGVPIGNAIVGERGREAVIPLTDSQQMAILGEEIGKNVVVNITNITELDGRQLARKTTQIIGDMQFASNGGGI